MRKKSKQFFYWIVLIFLYVILFEFILPANRILPKPVLLFESFFSLQKDYNFLPNFFYSYSGIYFSILIAYFIFRVTCNTLVNLLTNYSEVFKFIRSYRYFPLIGFITLFIYWFPSSVLSEFAFSVILSFTFFVKVLNEEIVETKPEYIDSILSITRNKNAIPEIINKSCQPAIFYSIGKLHIYLWATMLLFEFVKAQAGLGLLYKSALLYKDISNLFSISILIFITIYLSHCVIEMLHNKFFFWER